MTGAYSATRDAGRSARRWSWVVVVGAFGLSGCSDSVDAIWSPLTGEREPTMVESIPPSAAEQAATNQPLAPLGSQPAATVPSAAVTLASYNTLTDSKFRPTGTSVGQRVVQLRRDLQQLIVDTSRHAVALNQARDSAVSNAQVYHGLVAALNARLQVGTTPGNPVLVSQWNDAQASLDLISNQIGGLNQLSSQVVSTATVSSFLLDSTQATLSLSGAIDEDHRQLELLEDEVSRSVVLIDRLLNELNDDIQRQSSYIAAERRNLQALSLAISNGEVYGTSLANRAFLRAETIRERLTGAPAGGIPTGITPNATGLPDRVASAAPAAAPTAAQVGSIAGRRPLVVIRFDRNDVAYEQAVYQAVSRTLERRPESQFDLVAISPPSASPSQRTLLASRAQRNAEAVLRSLTALGLPLERISLSAAESQAAQTSEVHVYIR